MRRSKILLTTTVKSSCRLLDTCSEPGITFICLAYFPIVGRTLEDPNPGAEAGSNSPVVVVLPDNGRDPELAEVLRKAQQKYFATKRHRQPR